jgi:hypothetical protein
VSEVGERGGSWTEVRNRRESECGSQLNVARKQVVLRKGSRNWHKKAEAHDGGRRSEAKCLETDADIEKRK